MPVSKRWAFARRPPCCTVWAIWPACHLCATRFGTRAQGCNLFGSWAGQLAPSITVFAARLPGKTGVDHEGPPTIPPISILCSARRCGAHWLPPGSGFHLVGLGPLDRANGPCPPGRTIRCAEAMWIRGCCSGAPRGLFRTGLVDTSVKGQGGRRTQHLTLGTGILPGNPEGESRCS